LRAWKTAVFRNAGAAAAAGAFSPKDPPPSPHFPENRSGQRAVKAVDADDGQQRADKGQQRVRIDALGDPGSERGGADAADQQAEGGGRKRLPTKRGDEGAVYNRYAPGVVTYASKGYYKAREFYSPQYDNPKTNTQMQDLRSTIYWNPNIITDKEGNTSMSFFNADAKGTYRVIIEGIDAEGNLGRQVLKYKVE